MKILPTLLFSLIATVLYAQNVNYQVEIVEFRISGCEDGAAFLYDEEPTWKAWARDDINTTFVGGDCHYSDGNFPFTLALNNVTLMTSNNTAAIGIDIKLEAWEDDSGDRCAFDGGVLGFEDDCYIDNTFPTINFRSEPNCQWNQHLLESGDFAVLVRINWEYSDFTAGFDITNCGTTVPLSAEGSGSWSIYSGVTGSFGNVNDPNTNFAGFIGSHELLWSSFPGCLTTFTTDTVTVDFISTPDPVMTVSSNNFCEGTDIIFNAQNGTLYDWSLNTLGNVVLSDGSGAYILIPTLSDEVVYVTAANGACAGTDSIAFTVNPSPTPFIAENGGVLSTQIYPIYLWYFNGSPIPGATSIDYIPAQGGSYYVEVLNSSGCLGQSEPISYSGVGIDELIKNVSLYPNPTSGIVHFQSELPIELVTVYNSIGKKMQVNLSGNKLDLSQLSNGMYIVSLSINNHIITKRIILSK